MKYRQCSEVQLAVEWVAVEGRNPDIHDAELFYVADSQVFLVGLLNSVAKKYNLTPYLKQHVCIPRKYRLLI